MDEDSGFDRFLEEMYEDRYPEPYENDLEEWELNQLALDRDYDEPYDDEDGEEYDPDPDYGEPPF